MNSHSFDLVTVGGGLGASALAVSMARAGARVAVFEKETEFRDRVRGEAVAPWGVAEAKELGIADLLLETCAKEVPFFETGTGLRNLPETTPQKLPAYGYCHPEMQETLLAEAERAGAEVRRGMTVTAVEPGANNATVIARNSKEERFSARLVVAADGRGSAVRKWAGFAAQKSPRPFHFAGVLLTGVAGRDDVITFVFNPMSGYVVALVGLPKQRWRAYLGYPAESGLVLQGNQGLITFLEESKKVFPPLAEAYADVKSAGPLAAFESTESWVDHPYRQGVALLGDAAGTSDPTFGQGMSTTLRDARVLRDALVGQTDWDQAGHEFARRHDVYYHTLHKVCGWLRLLFQEQSPEARALRQRAMPRIAEDRSRVPDYLASGPDLPADETARKRLFGEC
jgi:2-polyprenyl-6-methoxyphenol hydroxylase-like FAD-dependent oxidoreductase